MLCRAGPRPAGRQQGIPWADRFAYCQPGSALPPGVQLAGSYWQPSCVMPLGQMYWVLAVQASGWVVGWEVVLGVGCWGEARLSGSNASVTKPSNSVQAGLCCVHTPVSSWVQAAPVELAGTLRIMACMPSGPLPHLLPPRARTLQCVGFTALAIYLDAVLPDAMGVRRPPWFFLQPSYWLRGGSVSAVRLCLQPAR